MLLDSLPKTLKNYDVVAVNEFGFTHIAQNIFYCRARLPENADGLFRTVVDESTGNLGACFLMNTGDEFTPQEIAFEPLHAYSQQTASRPTKHIDGA